MYLMRVRRKTKGAALTETMAGIIFIIPVVLFIIDVIAMVLCQAQHDAMVKDCARAAAEEASMTAGQTAATNVATRWNTAGAHYLFRVNSCNTTYPNGPASQTLRVQTNITFIFPVPIPLMGLSQQDFVAEATEPIIGRRAGQALLP